jgi:hypothetical protein
LRNVVEHEVDHETDPPVSRRPRRERLEILDRPQVGTNLAVVGHGIPAVVVSIAGPQQRHEVQIGDPELLEIVDPPADGLQRPGEPIGVGRVTEHPRALQPVGLKDAPLVQSVQLRIAIPVCRRRQDDQPGRDILGDVPVERRQRIKKVVPPAVQPQLEQLAAARDDSRPGPRHMRS